MAMDQNKVECCDECECVGFSPNIEAFETLDRILCDDCAPGALEEAADVAAEEADYKRSLPRE